MNYDQQEFPRRMIKELAYEERPLVRQKTHGVMNLSTAEVLANVLQSADALDLAQELLIRFCDLAGLARATEAELKEVRGIGPHNVGRIKAAIELGRRFVHCPKEERPRVSSPADVANLLMTEMMSLEQEHLRVVLLDTRNRVIDTPTVYIGSLNTSVVRIGEIFRAAIRANAAAIIVVHNHPSGDPSPSPEDVYVTKQLNQASKIMDIDVLDHVIIGYHRFASLKERGLGFDD
jgi:DNA repair protein RadC